MNKGALIGYFVVNDAGWPLILGCYEEMPGAGILMEGGGDATIFASYSRARAAINRTAIYAERRSYTWGVRRFRIRRARGPL